MMIKLSSVQNPGGQVWDHKGKTGLIQIFVSYNDDVIYSLHFVYAENGNMVMYECPGSNNSGRKFSTVKLNYPDEFLTSISGFQRSDSLTCKITSITFGTNRGSYGPFGRLGQNFYDSEFDYQMGLDQPFGGFHGTTSHGVLESIGVYVKPIAAPSNLNRVEVKKETVRNPVR